MNGVDIHTFFATVAKYEYEVIEETDNVHSYDSYMDKATGREIGYIEFHGEGKPETFHLWQYGI